jgi:hypothetical protein
VRRRVRRGLNVREALAAHLLEMASGEMTPDLMRRYLLHELDRLEAGPFECRWWAMPAGFELPGPPHGGPEWVRIELDGSVTDLS